MVRLENLSPELVGILKQTSENQQRQAAIVACHFARVHSQLQDLLFLATLQCLHNRECFSAHERFQIENLGAQLDERYFNLDEVSEAKREAGEDGSAEAAESSMWFRRARAANCLLRAMEADPFEASAEAIYEAAATIKTEAAVENMFDMIRALCL